MPEWQSLGADVHTLWRIGQLPSAARAAAMTIKPLGPASVQFAFERKSFVEVNLESDFHKRKLPAGYDSVRQ